MKLLVICVDRDNDLGTKVGIQTPVIGREDVLRAAIALGLKDPEEADTNSIFAGLKVYDDYNKSGVDAEIAVICGDQDVGIKSDSALSSQIDAVLGKVEPNSAILVSDGAEDEYIYPLLSSRIKIDGIKRVVVRQARNIESIYYMILRAFQEERVRRKFILPVALALIVFSAFSILTGIMKSIYGDSFPDLTWPVVFLTLGLYIVIKAYNLDEPLRAMSQDAKTAISTMPFLMLAAIIIVAGLIAGWNIMQAEWEEIPGGLDKDQWQLKQIVSIIGILLWAGVFAVILLGIGRALHIYIKGNDFPYMFFPTVFSILAFGSFFYCALFIFTFFSIPGQDVVDDIFLFWFLGMVFGILVYFSLSMIKEQEKTADWHQ